MGTHVDNILAVGPKRELDTAEKGIEQTVELQSNLYISLASGPEDPMLLERLCVYRGFV